MQFFFSNTPLLFFVQNLWRDEAYSVILARHSIVDIAKFTAGDFSPPLYYLILKLWIVFFGSSEVSVRSLSLLFYCITLFVMVELLVLILKIPIKRAIWYLLFFIANPFLLSYAFEARMYLMSACFVTLSYFFLWKKSWRWYIVSMTLALYTHYFTIIIFACQFVLSLSRTSKPSMLLKEGLPVLLLAPWIVFVMFMHPTGDGSFWILKPEIAQWWYLPFTLYTGYEPINAQYFHPASVYPGVHQGILVILSILPGSFLSVFCHTRHIRSYVDLKNKKIALSRLLHSKLFVLTAWAFVPPVALLMISQFGRPVFLPRYVISSVPGFLILMVYLFDQLWLAVKTSHLQKKLLIVYAVALILATKQYHVFNLLYHAKREVKPMYMQIASAMKSTDVVYVADVLDFHIAQYYLPKDAHIYVYQKTYRETPQYVGKVLIPSSVFTQTLPTFPARAFVVYYDWYDTRSLL